MEKLKEWLLNPNQNFYEKCNNLISRKVQFSISPRLEKYKDNNKREGEINLITQFYIDKNKIRHKEILKTLYLNVHNKSIDKIYLLNERLYTNDELNIESDKIIQIVLNKRMSYCDIFELIDNIKISGYIIIANSDIFFDKTIERVKYYDLTNKNIITLCRYEYKTDESLKNLELFDNGRPDSQDVWIYHSDNNIISKYRSLFDFMLGKPGCDNKIIYLFNLLGYLCYNEPTIIKSYHYHVTQIRNYSSADIVPGPYYALFPILRDSLCLADDKKITFNFLLENKRLYNYINKKLYNNENFIIPRVAGIENNAAFLGFLMLHEKQINNKDAMLNNIKKIMKNNAGIYLSNDSSIINYSKLYLDAFLKAEIYFDWEPWGNVAEYISNSLMFIHSVFNKPRIWSHVLNIYNLIHVTPWTHVFKGKRLLIISAFIESIKEKLIIKDKIYGIDLFPDCEFIFIKPPQTQGDISCCDFNIELDSFVKKIKVLSNNFDIALVSCGGYGNLVCNEIYKMGKSSLYIGGVLQMYFGIYGERWIREAPEILSLYKNEYWTRPLDNEKPSGYKQIEESCYW